MKTRIFYPIVIFLFILSHSCASLEQFSDGRATRFSVHAGVNSGGITENTDMSVVPGAAAPPEAIVDAFSGSTTTGYHIGGRVTQRVRRLELETGLDYMVNHQSFNYIDAGNYYMGQRDLEVTQFMIPVTLNIPVLNLLVPASDLRLRVGYMGQVNRVTTMDMGILPGYSIHDWSGGLTLGITAYPFHFNNGSQLGFYLDAYRGGQVYEDFYNQPSFEMPGSSFGKLGITYKFR